MSFSSDAVHLSSFLSGHLDSCHLRCRTYIRYRTCMTYDVVRATYDIVLYIVRAMSYVLYTGYRRTTSYVLHCTYLRCRTCTYDIVSVTYDIVGCHLNIPYTMSYVLNGRMISYVHEIRYRRCISYTTSYSYMTYDVVCQHTISYARHTMSYVFWRGPSQLFQRNQIPCPQQKQMGCACPTASLRSSFLASQQARQCHKHSLCCVLAP